MRSLYFFVLLRKEGDSNPRYPNRVRQFSKLVVSATHPSFQTLASALEWCKCRQKKQMCKISEHKFFLILVNLPKLLNFSVPFTSVWSVYYPNKKKVAIHSRIATLTENLSRKCDGGIRCYVPSCDNNRNGSLHFLHTPRSAYCP